MSIEFDPKPYFKQHIAPRFDSMVHLEVKPEVEDEIKDLIANGGRPILYANHQGHGDSWPLAIATEYIRSLSLNAGVDFPGFVLPFARSILTGHQGMPIKVLTELRTSDEHHFTMPRVCPSCKTKLEKSETEVLLRCPNTNCPARQRRGFYHFVSKKAFDIDGLGPKIIDRLLDEGLVQDPSDIFSLKEGDLASLERFGEKSAENVVAAIQEKKEIPLSRFVYALGIRNIGAETAVDLAGHFGSLEKLREAKLEDFDSIANIGPIVAKSVYEWFCDKGNGKFLDKLLRQVKVIKVKVESSKLSGKTFVFTGTLNGIERESAKEKVRALGGQISESVSAKTDFVVVGAEPGSKAEKAKKLGVKILDEKEFLELIK